MTKTFCDRCGKEITKSEYGWLSRKIIYSTIRLCPHSSDVGTIRDKDENACICPDCEKSFEEWFKGYSRAERNTKNFFIYV